MFSLGFMKIADNAATGGTNNQGLEFKTSDTHNTTANVGPGGATPDGIEAYQPAPKEPKGRGRFRKLAPPEIASLFTSTKIAGSREWRGRMDSDAGNSTGIVRGLKQNQETPDATHEEVSSKAKAEQERMKRYARVAK